MDTTTIVTNLALDWRCTERTPPGAALLDSIADAFPRSSGVGLIGALEPAGPLVATERFALLAFLLEASVEPVARRGLLQALVPGLLGLGRQLSWGAGGPWSSGGDLFVDALSTTVEVTTDWAGQHRPYAGPDVLSAVRCRLERQRAAHRRHRAAALEAAPGIVDVCDPHAGSTVADTIVAAAARVVDPIARSAIVGRAVLGCTWAELARDLGLDRRTVVAAARVGVTELVDGTGVASPPRREDAPGER